ncbi:MAG: cell wall-binding repeat-containing protein [Microcella pacifica]
MRPSGRPRSIASRETTATETAAKIAREYAPFSPGEGVVYVATGQGFADALSAAAAAAYLDAPLLLTAPTSLPSVIKTEIVRLKPQTIIIVGGTSVVSTGVENALKKLAPTVERQAGSDRYTTSRIVSREAFEADGATTAFVATGSGFADALAAASAAGSMGAPVVLVDGSSFSRAFGDQDAAGRSRCHRRLRRRRHRGRPRAASSPRCVDTASSTRRLASPAPTATRRRWRSPKRSSRAPTGQGTSRSGPATRTLSPVLPWPAAGESRSTSCRRTVCRAPCSPTWSRPASKK